ncbi:MAG: 2-oxoacid:acceptor oxidoreductase subunit alpha [Dehalococcoidales bacterium]|nr:2-oxoacid:acceptor oxidoreductase subunit alpha [Dehalococcoidales bacterium]
MTQTLNFMVSGEAGQGVQSIGFLLAKALARYGYYVFSDQDYESRVRGGSNFFRVRASLTPVNAIKDKINILLAFSRQGIEQHHRGVAQTGFIIYDTETLGNLNVNDTVSIPAARLSKEATGDMQSANTVLLAAALCLLGYSPEDLLSLLQSYFRGEAAVNNVKAAQAGFQYVREHISIKMTTQLRKIGNKSRMLVHGNEALSLGAIAAGCKFMAAYPMTPITSIIEYLSGKAVELGMVVVPAEDEIAAINMVTGASYAGVRAMTATSGGGFCLMVEGLGLAAMTETPIVVVEGQRPGPAIGLPTRQEQGDLDFMLHAAHGEFPRVILTPSTAEECFWAAVKAFNLAEKYQLTVIIMTDHHLATSYSAVERFDLTRVEIDRGVLYSKNSGEYKRHQFTADGISPRAFPGKPGTLVVTDSDEHDEAGHLTEDPEIRSKMVNKRLGKMVALREEIRLPKLWGAEQPEIIVAGWGSTFGAIREAVTTLTETGVKIAHLHFSEIWPFPKDEVGDILQDCPKVMVAENNATGQLAKLIQRETCIHVNDHVLRYDGRPFTPAEIIAAVGQEVK